MSRSRDEKTRNETGIGKRMLTGDATGMIGEIGVSGIGPENGKKVHAIETEITEENVAEGTFIWFQLDCFACLYFLI